MSPADTEDGGDLKVCRRRLGLNTELIIRLEETKYDEGGRRRDKISNGASGESPPPDVHLRGRKLARVSLPAEYNPAPSRPFRRPAVLVGGSIHNEWDPQRAPEYDLDEEDEEFLQQQEGLDMTESDFERTMDALEQSAAAAAGRGNKKKIRRTARALMKRRGHPSMAAVTEAVFNYWEQKRSRLLDLGWSCLQPKAKAGSASLPSLAKRRRRPRRDPYACFRPRSPERGGPFTRNNVRKRALVRNKHN